MCQIIGFSDIPIFRCSDNLILQKKVYRSICRIKPFEMPVFIGDFVSQGAWNKN